MVRFFDRGLWSLSAVYVALRAQAAVGRSCRYSVYAEGYPGSLIRGLKILPFQFLSATILRCHRARFENISMQRIKRFRYGVSASPIVFVGEFGLAHLQEFLHASPEPAKLWRVLELLWRYGGFSASPALAFFCNLPVSHKQSPFPSCRSVVCKSGDGQRSAALPIANRCASFRSRLL